MSATTKLTFEQFQGLPEVEGKRYELDEGELLMEPSPTLRHNLIRQRTAIQLTNSVDQNHPGLVAEQMDFRLRPDTIKTLTWP